VGLCISVACFHRWTRSNSAFLNLSPEASWLKDARSKFTPQFDVAANLASYLHQMYSHDQSSSSASLWKKKTKQNTKLLLATDHPQLEI